MQIETGFADVNGTRLYYEMAGSGHPLILIHGNTLDTRMWDDQFEVFAEHYQVMRYDARGFGQSAVPTTGDTYTHPEDLRALMTHLGIDHAHIIGLSMGGRIAIDFALAYPEVTDTLIPVDAGVSGYQWLGERAVVAVSMKAKQEGIKAAKALWLKCDLFVPAAEEAEVASRLKQIVDDYSGWHFVNDDPASVPEPAAIDRLDTLTMPTLVVIGDRDIPDFQRMANIMVEQIVGAKKVVIPKVGHMSNMEDPKRFNEMVLGFLAEEA